jgi:hypothetical protein
MWDASGKAVVEWSLVTVIKTRVLDLSVTRNLTNCVCLLLLFKMSVEFSYKYTHIWRYMIILLPNLFLLHETVSNHNWRHCVRYHVACHQSCQSFCCFDHKWRVVWNQISTEDLQTQFRSCIGKKPVKLNGKLQINLNPFTSPTFLMLVACTLLTNSPAGF